MTRPIRRSLAVLLLLGADVAACGNSGDDDDATPTTPAEGGDTTTTSGDGTTGTTAGDGEGGDRDTFVPIEGVPGVTDEQIGYAVIGTRSGNPLGTCILDCYAAGIEAYFAFRNDEGGIYGRDLVLKEKVDDALGQNQQKALDIISAKKSFGVFQAVLLATGEHCPVQAFRIGDHQYATQFHPELDPEAMLARVALYRHSGYFPPSEVEAVAARVAAADVHHSHRVLSRFAERYRS